MNLTAVIWLSMALGSAVSVNGKKISLSPSAGKFVRIARVWENNDAVTLKLPMEISLRRWALNHDSVSVNYRPLTFSLQIGESVERMDSAKTAQDDSAWQKSADPSQWPSIGYFPTTPWNYGLALESRHPEKSFKIKKLPWPKDDYPFTPESSPLELTVQAKKIPQWTLDKYGLCAVLQQSPAQSSQPLEKVTLIPMGAARLRISAFPIIGAGPRFHRWNGGPRSTNDAVSSLPPSQHYLPEGWVLRPIAERPCLLFGPEEIPAIKARLPQFPGSMDSFEEKMLLTCFAGDEASRRKATTDFIAYWKSYSQRWTREDLFRDHPDGVAMRGIWRSLYLYDVVDSFGFLTAAERAEFRETLVQAIHWAIGPDKAHRQYRTDNSRNGNIYSDVVVAAGTTGLAFPELPESREWIEFATDELAWQLHNSIWEGAWNENPRYHAHMLKITGLFYQSLKRRTGVDMFQEPNYKAMLDWMIRFGTPPDKAAGAKIGLPDGVMLMPGIGDSSWTRGPYGLCAMFAPQYTKTDPAFAARLMWAWQRAGKPDQGDNVEWMKVLADPSLPAQAQTLGSDSSPKKGYALMRSGFDTPDELWFLLRCGRRSLVGHDHADWNAFNLYAFGYPLALDSGSGEYTSPMHKAWNDKAVSHNTVVFGERSQKRADGKFLAFATTPQADYSVTDASVPAEVPQFIRTVVFVKPSYYVIWDQLKSSESAKWILHTPATEFQWSAHKVHCITPWPVSLDVHVVLPETPLTPGVKKGIFQIQDVPGELPFTYQNYFEISNAPGANFLTVLHPMKNGAAPLTIKRSGSVKNPVLSISCEAQQDRVELHKDGVRVIRNGPVQETFSLGREAFPRNHE